MQFHDKVLCSSSGQIYRIACIINPNFSDDIAVNPSDECDDGGFEALGYGD